MSRGSDVAAGFARRFAGLERAHGHYTPARPGPDGTKVDGRAVTERSPATLSLWEAHLKGAYGVGVVPIRDDATCVFTSAHSELRIAVETMDPPHSEYMKQAEQCGAGTTPLKAIGNEAVVCSPNARAARVVGRVRNRIFTILITTTDSSTASDLLREKAHAVAEQVAGILF